MSNDFRAVIERHSQLELSIDCIRSKPAFRVAVLAIAFFCNLPAQAQTLFRQPVVPPARTVSTQVIDRANIPIILGQRDLSESELAELGEGVETIDSTEPMNSFLPPSMSSGNNELESDRSLDDLSDDEFQSRLMEIQGRGDVSDDSSADALPAEPTFENDKSGRETIRQRYPDGKTHVLRQVAQDAAGNYYNDGAWRVFSRGGDVIAEGQFERNQMTGQWRRYHNARSGGLFSTAPFNKYEGRFLSVAAFNDGKLNGMWTIYDQNNQKVFEVRYSEGKRDGVANWWYPTATKMREAAFDDGLLDGKVVEWDEQGKLTRRDDFINGQRVVRQVSRYRPNRPSEEQFYLDGKLELDGEDRWWEAKPAAFSTTGQRTQHGPIRRWYENGQSKMRGQYEKDNRVGQFTWWHLNGGRKLVAEYDKGQKSGMWTWWHESGMKSIQGEYQDNVAVGVWTWWDENGKVARQEDFDKRNGEQEGTRGELTAPEPSTREDDAKDPTIMEAPVDDSNSAEDDQDLGSVIPLLLDTDGLEEIDPLDNTSGELPDAVFGDE